MKANKKAMKNQNIKKKSSHVIMVMMVFWQKLIGLAGVLSLRGPSTLSTQFLNLNIYINKYHIY
jgi:hypothetical protein